MRYKDVVYLFAGLAAVSNVKGADFKFVYAVAKNIRKLKSIVEDLEAPLKAPKELIEYERERMKFVDKYGKKDEEGKPVTYMDGDQTRHIIENRKEFDDKINELKSRPKYKKAIDDQEIVRESYDKKLEEKCTDKIDIHKIDQKDVPIDKDGKLLLTSKQLEGIFDIIK